METVHRETKLKLILAQPTHPWTEPSSHWVGINFLIFFRIPSTSDDTATSISCDAVGRTTGPTYASLKINVASLTCGFAYNMSWLPINFCEQFKSERNISSTCNSIAPKKEAWSEISWGIEELLCADRVDVQVAEYAHVPELPFNTTLSLNWKIQEWCIPAYSCRTIAGSMLDV